MGKYEIYGHLSIKAQAAVKTGWSKISCISGYSAIEIGVLPGLGKVNLPLACSYI